MATKKTIKKVETPNDSRETFVSLQKTFADSDLSVTEKLKVLYQLQAADNEIGKLVQLRGELPAEVRDAYLESTHLTLADIIRKVYREPMPNRFLASTSLFIGQHIEREDVRQLVVENFRLFFRRNIVPYGRRDLSVNFVGSVAFYYENLLREAAREERFEVGAVMKSPLEGLVNYVISIRS